MWVSNQQYAHTYAPTQCIHPLDHRNMRLPAHTNFVWQWLFGVHWTFQHHFNLFSFYFQKKPNGNFVQHDLTLHTYAYEMMLYLDFFFDLRFRSQFPLELRMCENNCEQLNLNFCYIIWSDTKHSSKNGHVWSYLWFQGSYFKTKRIHALEIFDNNCWYKTVQNFERCTLVKWNAKSLRPLLEICIRISMLSFPWKILKFVNVYIDMFGKPL